jgi:hypothetical protein
MSDRVSEADAQWLEQVRIFVEKGGSFAEATMIYGEPPCVRRYVKYANETYGFADTPDSDGGETD